MPGYRPRFIILLTTAYTWLHSLHTCNGWSLVFSKEKSKCVLDPFLLQQPVISKSHIAVQNWIALRRSLSVLLILLHVPVRQNVFHTDSFLWQILQLQLKFFWVFARGFLHVKHGVAPRPSKK